MWAQEDSSNARTAVRWEEEDEVEEEEDRKEQVDSEKTTKKVDRCTIEEHNIHSTDTDINTEVEGELREWKHKQIDLSKDNTCWRDKKIREPVESCIEKARERAKCLGKDKLPASRRKKLYA